MRNFGCDAEYGRQVSSKRRVSCKLQVGTTTLTTLARECCRQTGASSRMEFEWEWEVWIRRAFACWISVQFIGKSRLHTVMADRLAASDLDLKSNQNSFSPLPSPPLLLLQLSIALVCCAVFLCVLFRVLKFTHTRTQGKNFPKAQQQSELK